MGFVSNTLLFLFPGVKNYLYDLLIEVSSPLVRALCYVYPVAISAAVHPRAPRMRRFLELLSFFFHGFFLLFCTVIIVAEAGRPTTTFTVGCVVSKVSYDFFLVVAAIPPPSARKVSSQRL